MTWHRISNTTEKVNFRFSGGVWSSCQPRMQDGNRQMAAEFPVLDEGEAGQPADFRGRLGRHLLRP